MLTMFAILYPCNKKCKVIVICKSFILSACIVLVTMTFNKKPRMLNMNFLILFPRHYIIFIFDIFSIFSLYILLNSGERFILCMKCLHIQFSERWTNKMKVSWQTQYHNISGIKSNKYTFYKMRDLFQQEWTFRKQQLSILRSTFKVR